MEALVPDFQGNMECVKVRALLQFCVLRLCTLLLLLPSWRAVHIAACLHLAAPDMGLQPQCPAALLLHTP